MVAYPDWVVEVRFLLEYGNVIPHRREQFDSATNIIYYKTKS